MNRKTLPALLAAAALAGGTGGAAIVSAVEQPAAAPASVATARLVAASTTSTASTASEVYRKVSAGVVDIKATGVSSGQNGSPYAQPPTSSGPYGSPYAQPPSSSSTAEGSGFVIDTKGDIVTNEHVIDGASKIEVTFADGSTATARLVKADASSDIAVLRVTVASSKLHPLSLADSSQVSVGDSVLAVGSPFGLEQSLTAGIVSATDRSIDAPNNATIAGAIQTDAAINHGNSGGPLLNSAGQVIGVNAQIASESGGNDGVGFAIASNTVRSVVSQLVAGQTAQHASLGVVVGDGSGGATIGSVTSGGAAAKAGVRSGDLITAVDGVPVSGADALAAAIAGHKPGDTVHLTLRRSGNATDVTVTLGAR
jgi:putative serine protease PepD